MAAESSTTASCWLTATRATDDAFSSEERPTAQTTPTATTVPSEASASRADSTAERVRRMPSIMPRQSAVCQLQVVPAVLGVGLLVVPGIARALRSVADGGDPVRGDAHVDQVVA